VNWYEETLHDDLRERLAVGRVLYRDRTGQQDLIIFENPKVGRVLALDGVIQTTEGDEFIYHEMLAHVPILAHGNVKRVLIVGGGDGGCLREVLRHPTVERATMVEIDPGVIELSKEHLPSLSSGAFDDPRAQVVIADGAEYMAADGERFDVIIVDSTDPIGPGEVLFSEAFYTDCKKRLTESGILVTQNGVPFMQGEEVTSTWRAFRKLFADPGFYVAAVPTYQGGFMTLGWGTDDMSLRRQDPAAIAERYAAAGIETRYYNPDIHFGAFALPNYVTALMTE